MIRENARVQYHLRQVFVNFNVHPINRSEVMVPSAGEKFDENGKLKNEKTRTKILEMLENLLVRTKKLKI